MHITPKELTVLRTLANGLSYADTCFHLRMTRGTLYVHCLHIRKKTGISTRDWRACRDWLSNNPEVRKRAVIPTVPTATQFKIMELFGQGKNFDTIAQALGIKRQTVMNQLSDARFRAGLKTPPPGVDRSKQIRDYLASSQLVTMADEMFQ